MLKDPSCLVPCNGLYVDVSDDALKRTMMEGEYFFSAFTILNIKDNLSGFRSISDGLHQCGMSEQLHRLEQLFKNTISIEQNVAEYESFTEQYKDYKESYVKNLRFDPGAENLSISEVISIKDELLLFQLLQSSMLHLRQCTYFSTLQLMMR